jgi:toxin ParE1/3/4
MKVGFTPTARRQLNDVVVQIMNDGPDAALAFRQRAERSRRRLERRPSSGRRVPELPDLPFREVIVPPYRLFYAIRETPQGQAVRVVAVWHDAQVAVSPDESHGG